MQAIKNDLNQAVKTHILKEMPDDNLPVSAGINLPNTANKSSLEDDFPTLVSQPGTISPQSPPATVPTPEPSQPETPTETPNRPTVPSASIDSETPLSSFPVSTNPSTPTNLFTPLGGKNTESVPGGTTFLPHVQFASRPVAGGGFETLEKVVNEFSNKKDQEIITTNIYPDAVPQPTATHHNPLVITGILIFIFSLIALSCAGIYAISYGYLDIKNPTLTTNLSNFIQSLPLTPKTPKYLLTQTAIAQKSITKESFDLSLAIRSKQLETAFSSTSIEAAFKGSIDYSDPKNVISTLNAAITKDFNADIISKDNKIYFHINQLPLTILALVGLSEVSVKPLIADWVMYDATPLGTEANKILDNQTNQDPSYKEFVQKIQNILFNKQVLSNIVVSEDQINKTPVYKLHFIADADTIDYLYNASNTEFNQKATIPSDKKYSDYLQGLTIEMWIEKDNYNLRKLNLSFRVINYTPDPTLATSQTSSDIAVSYSLSEIGKDVKITLPTNPITTDQFILRINQKFTEIGQQNSTSSPSGQLNQPIQSFNYNNLLIPQATPTP
jgi:hypothetical protein